ncbi:hypothetical protein F2P81_018504 [Scophthalmus maximus]|uniref:Uncharacterized protein n=1 Tax=Scophthalmus maximus TaxID=52904 RepID=A0A6A4S9Z5_SCOMX|nr:hypothetical protein F2P81_018504 [Scophthalmus maximus]
MYVLANAGLHRAKPRKSESMKAYSGDFAMSNVQWTMRLHSPPQSHPAVLLSVALGTDSDLHLQSGVRPGLARGVNKYFVSDGMMSAVTETSNYMRRLSDSVQSGFQAAQA